MERPDRTLSRSAALRDHSTRVNPPAFRKDRPLMPDDPSKAKNATMRPTAPLPDLPSIPKVVLITPP